MMIKTKILPVTLGVLLTLTGCSATATTDATNSADSTSSSSNIVILESEEATEILYSEPNGDYVLYAGTPTGFPAGIPVVENASTTTYVTVSEGDGGSTKYQANFSIDQATMDELEQTFLDNGWVSSSEKNVTDYGTYYSYSKGNWSVFLTYISTDTSIEGTVLDPTVSYLMVYSDNSDTDSSGEEATTSGNSSPDTTNENTSDEAEADTGSE